METINEIIGKLKKSRLHHREFFDFPLRNAIQVVEQTIQEVAQQTSLTFQKDTFSTLADWWHHPQANSR